MTSNQYTVVSQNQHNDQNTMEQNTLFNIVLTTCLVTDSKSSTQVYTVQLELLFNTQISQPTR